jgi:hypothetical protein
MKNHPIAASVAFLVMISALGALTVSQMMGRSGSGHGETAADSPSEPTVEAKQLARDIRAAVRHGMEGRLEQAESELAVLVDAHPSEPLVWMNYGVALSARQKYDEAEDAFERVLELRPETWSAHAELATIHLLTGELDEAIEALEVIPPGEGRLAERLHRDPIWRKVDDPRVEKLRRQHREIPETSLHADDVTAEPDRE